MRLKSLITLIFSVLLCSYLFAQEPNFLFPGNKQLNELGIVISEKGVFYKNHHCTWEQNHERFSFLSFYSTKDVYLTTKHYNVSETPKANNRYDRMLERMEVSNHDFYPVLIGNERGDYSLDSELVSEEEELFPVAIDLSKTSIKNRDDILVIWFRPTPSLEKLFQEEVDVDKYLRTRI